MTKIPDYQTLMLPLLRIAADRAITIDQATQRLAVELQLTPEQRNARLPSGRYRLIHHRAHWARTHMTRAGLIEPPRRGLIQATERGRQLLTRQSDRIDIGTLASFGCGDGAAAGTDSALHGALIARIFAIADVPRRSTFFEDLSVDLLLAMGYGGGRKVAAVRLGRSGDGGVDAVIKLDPLGLDLLHLQAKCYAPDHLVDVAAVRDFSGSLDDKKASRGVLTTTSRFTKGARDYVRAIAKPIVLIDGAELTRLMIEHGVGVRDNRSKAVKEVDEGYFEKGG